MKRIVMTVAVVLLSAGSAWAQVCIGREPGELKVGGGAAFGSGFSAFAGGVGLDKEQYYVDVSGAVANAGGSVYGFLASGGYKIDLKGMSKPMQVCPSGNVVKMFGLGANPFAFSVGATFGIDMMKANTTSIVPNFGIYFNRNTFYGGGNSFSGNVMSLTAGVGLIFNEKMALVPSVWIPLSNAGGQVTFQVAFSYKLH